MHFVLRRLIDEHPDKIRLVHRHFPMDHNFNPIVKAPFHIGSGKMALMAIYAASKGKFWQMNDALYEIVNKEKTINIKKLAEDVELNPEALVHSVNNQLIRKKLQRDILSGLKLRISGTPAYIINKEVYLSQIPPEIIRSALKR
jgi:protein-disulfide isomerase